MTQQVINNGSFVDDPSAENLYSSFGKANSNFTDLYKGVQQAERDTATRLVYPYIYAQTNDYNADGTLNYIETSDGTTTWRQTYAYNADGTVDTITAIDGSNTWIKTFTYLAGQLTGASNWVLQ